MGLTLSPYNAAAILITLAAALSWFNHRFLRLPTSVALALMGALASVAVIAIDAVLPASDLGASARALANVNFHDALMNGMLSFLLFAGALHVDLEDLKRGKWQVGILSTFGVLVSTLIIGLGLQVIATLARLHIPLLWCMIFGALISPTDPVAVLGVMKGADAPPALQATVSGESLFNDGIGVVVFSVLLAAASGPGLSMFAGAQMFALEAIGGALLGLAIGIVGFRAMRAIDDYAVELLITLAIVMGGYALASALHVSGPVAMAAAGLLIGNHGVQLAMTEATRDHVIKFWGLIDEVLNAILFLLIGLLGVTLLAGVPIRLLVGVACIPLVLAARAISIAAPLPFWRKLLPFRTTFPVMVWGGLRGGISIAMALALPAGEFKDLIVTITYVVVLFSVLVQGSTIRRIVPAVSASNLAPPGKS
jgi:CPA1 family monovalent cation:H+ antiporter